MRKILLIISLLLILVGCSEETSGVVNTSTAVNQEQEIKVGQTFYKGEKGYFRFMGYDDGKMVINVEHNRNDSIEQRYYAIEPFQTVEILEKQYTDDRGYFVIEIIQADINSNRITLKVVAENFDD